MKRKNLLLVAFATVTLNGISQTLYVPSSTSGIGLSTTANVGIGVSAPSQKLEVNGSVKAGSALLGNSPWGSTYACFRHSSCTTNANYSLLQQSNGATYLNAPSTANIHFRIDNETKMQLNSSGNFGIGCDPEDFKLKVAGNGKFIGSRNGDFFTVINQYADVSTSNTSLIWGCYAYGTSQVNNPQLLSLTRSANYVFLVRNNGQVGINCDPGNSSHMLTVNGSILAKEIQVANIAADFVFDKSYKLRSLKEVENFIKLNGHLPDVASASETAKGVNLGEFNETLLQKIEELTLYVIELKKQNEQLVNRIGELEKK